jgi:hypothetical protein
VVWTPLGASETKSSFGATFATQDDKSILVSGTKGKGSYTITLPSELAHFGAIRLELLPDPSLPSGGPGRAVNGNLAISELRATAAPKSDPAKATNLAFAKATADFNQEGLPVTNAIDGNPGTGWAIHPKVGQPTMGIFELRDAPSFEGGVLLTLVIDQQFDEEHQVGKFRVSVTDAKGPLQPSTLPANITALVAIKPAERSDAQKAELAAYYRSLDSDWEQLSAAVKAAEELAKNERLAGAQDLAWALINSPAFLFNR